MALGIDPASALARPLILGSRLFRLARPEIERVGRDTMALFGAVRHNAFFWAFKSASGQQALFVTSAGQWDLFIGCSDQWGLSLLLDLTNRISSCSSVQTNSFFSLSTVFHLRSLFLALIRDLFDLLHCTIDSLHYVEISTSSYSLHITFNFTISISCTDQQTLISTVLDHQAVFITGADQSAVFNTSADQQALFITCTD